MSTILPNVKHIVVVMFENRSLDTMLGWLYPEGAAPQTVLPPGSSPAFNGVKPDMWNPSTHRATPRTAGAPDQPQAGRPNDGKPVFVTQSAASRYVPDPDPNETFINITEQILGPQSTDEIVEPMHGFVLNYETTSTHDSTQVMQCHSEQQLPVMFALARAYAVSDAWFASVPSQTWPNRAFAQAGTSNGNVNNTTARPGSTGLDLPDPFQWDVRTIFNVLQDVGESWAVYHDTLVVPPLTRTMFPQLWDEALSPNFQHFSAFEDACAAGSLPRFSFIEPSFVIEPNDQHPPHDVKAGEHFLHRIWKAVSRSPAWNDTLLLITFDEHGGTFDHVLPPANAVSPDAASDPGDENFRFDRFGVRVPAILVSPYIAPGTVFRSPIDTPYDHTSILATLRDWLAIPNDSMLPSTRIAAAPTFEQVLTLSEPRTELPKISEPLLDFIHPSPDAPINDLQLSLVSGSAHRFNLDVGAVTASVTARAHAVTFFTALKDQVEGKAKPTPSP
ncbi:alkaline phosphatase family protein [Burkholderia perseverans]|uniref:alkaline phosphatase family protein n=1 Tax=Burkholderia perseverans TaxID=2615214 RepID=UPI001FEF12AE|nr:alkaline phosphatase family protein [Burkholderia perseverans]